MKKVKIMLASVVLFAAVGGALAFKAKSFGVGYCKGEPYVQGIAQSACPIGTLSKEEGSAFFYAKQTDNTLNCANQECPSLAITVE
jgi:hypothetical protein